MSELNEHREQKKRVDLEEMKRENIFRVPEGYFEELPGIIQSRVTNKDSKEPWWKIYLTPANSWNAALATAIVALIIVFAGIFDNRDINMSVEDMIAEVSLEDLIEYVEYSEITTDEILAQVDLSDYEMEFLMGDEIQLLDDSDFDDIDAIDLYEEYGLEEELF